MSLFVFNDVLSDVARVLISPVVSTTLGTAVTPGSQTVTPGSMAGIYVGALLIVGAGATQEIVTVTAASTTTFTAVFLNSHASTDAVFGATFPEGQPLMPLYTQPEVLSYAVESQKDFLLRTRVLVSVGKPTNPTGVEVDIVPGSRFVAQPEQAIRVERVALDGMDLLNTSQAALDAMQDYIAGTSWPGDTEQFPKQWFQDSVDTEMIGLWPIPNQNGMLECWFGDRGPDSVTLTTPLSVPDIFMAALKYRTLQKCFEKAGEMRDAKRATVCELHYKLYVFLGEKFYKGVEAALRESGAKKQSQRTNYANQPPVAGMAGR